MRFANILASCVVMLSIFNTVVMGDVSPIVTAEEMSEIRDLIGNRGFENNSRNGASGFAYNATIDGWSWATTNKGFCGVSTPGTALLPSTSLGGKYAAFFQMQGDANVSSVSLSQVITNKVEGNCVYRLLAGARSAGDNMLVQLFIDNVERKSFLVNSTTVAWFEADDIYLTAGEHVLTLYVTSTVDGDNTVGIYEVSLKCPLEYPSITVTSSSPIGEPFPAYGFNYLNPSAGTLTFSFPESWTSDDGQISLSSMGGYKLFEIDEVTGQVLSLVDERANAFEGTFAIPDGGAYRLEWYPVFDVAVSVTAGDGGSLTSSINGFYTFGTTISTTAVPNEGKVFRCWSGDLPDGCDSLSPTLSFTCDAVARNITAVFSDAIYVAPDGDDAADGASLDTALLTIQAAVTAATDNEVIFVAPGTYLLDSTIAVTKPVLIRGLSGNRDDVVLDAQLKRTAIKVTSDGATIAYLTVANGYASTGGGIWLAGYGEIRSCHITECQGPRLGYGAGVYNNNGKVIDCIIDKCYTTQDLNAGLALYQMGANALTDGCHIRDNRSSLFNSTSSYKTSPGAYIAAGIIRNCVIANNAMGIQNAGGTGGSAAGVYIAGGSMANCAVFGNSVFSELASTQNRDFSAVHQSGGTISNCVIYANTFHGFDRLTDYRGTAKIYNSALSSTNGIAGVNLIEVEDPLLTYTPDATPSLHLDMNSPLIDAGLNSEWMTFGRDLNGESRLKGDFVDIGPIEYQSDVFSCGFTTDRDIASGVTPFKVTFTPYVNCDEANVEYYWRIADSSGNEERLGPYGAANKELEYTFDEGIFSVTLLAINTATAVGAVYAFPTSIFTRPPVAYVDAASTNPSYPYSTPETAATNILDAIANPVNGLVVSLLPGEHLVKETIVIDSPITIRGLSTEQSIVKGDGSGRIFRLRHSRATLENILIRGGHINSSAIYPTTYADPAGYIDSDGTHRAGGGAVWIDCGGIVTNCVVEACTGVRGASALGIFNHGGVVSHTIFRNFNTTVGANNYGIVIRSYMRGLFTHCVISNINVKGLGSEAPTGVADIRGGELRNSLITDCYLSWSKQKESNTSGVLLFDEYSKMTSCTVTENSLSSIYGAAVRVNSGAKVVNSVIVNNANSANADDWSGDGAGAGISYTMTSEVDGLTGEGNIEAPSNVFLEDTFGVTIGSPAVGVGIKESWMEDALDLAGLSRLEEDNKLTLGAFAYNPPEYGVDWSHNVTLEAFENVSGTISIAVVGYSDDATYSWYIDDVLVGEGKSYNLNSSDYGKHILKLVIAEGEHTSVTEAEFYVIPKTIYVAEGNEGTFPYASWETACGNLSTAIGSAHPTTTIVVSDGTYQLSSMHNIVDPLTIRSVNGPYKTTIKARSGSRHFYLANSEILIEGFTLIGGSAQGAGSIYNIGATIRNCRFTDNIVGRNCQGLSVLNEGGHLDGCEFYGALIGSAVPSSSSDITYGQVYQVGAGAITERCIFRDNVFRNRHQGSLHYSAAGVHMAGGIVRTSLFYNNRWSNGKEGAATRANSAAAVYMTGGTVENCTFVNNQTCILDPTAPEGTSTNGLGSHCISAGISAPSLSVAKSIVNCIFVDNTNSFGEVSEVYAKTGVAVNCRVDELTETLLAQECIDADPVFRNSVAIDYRISSSDPCAKAGLYRSSWMEAAMDLAGKPLVRGVIRAPLGCYGVGYPTIFIMR